MELKNTIFAILAIFCVVLSACAVSATDDISDNANDYYLDGSHDGHDGLIIPPDYNHDEAAQHAAGGDVYDNGVPYHGDGTDPTANATGNVTGNVTCNVTGNTTGNVTGNVTGHAAGATVTANATNATATHMPATGNPIVALLAVCALVGGYTVLRRK